MTRPRDVKRKSKLHSALQRGEVSDWVLTRKARKARRQEANRAHNTRMLSWGVFLYYASMSLQIGIWLTVVSLVYSGTKWLLA